MRSEAAQAARLSSPVETESLVEHLLLRRRGSRGLEPIPPVLERAEMWNGSALWPPTGSTNDFTIRSVANWHRSKPLAPGSAVR